MPFTEDELTIKNIKRCCERHFAVQIGTSLVCDILAGEQSPSCKTLEAKHSCPDSLLNEVKNPGLKCTHGHKSTAEFKGKG